VIDQQERTEAGASGDDLGAPFSLPVLSKSALTHHLPRPAVVLPPAVVRSPRVGPPGVPFLPSMDRSEDATGGLCIGWSRADHRGLGGRRPPTSCSGYIPGHCLLLLSLPIN